MRPPLSLALLAPLLLIASGAAPPPDDEAHRLDRLETQRLNALAAAKLVALAPPKPTVAPAIGPAPTIAEQALRLREEQAIAAWRQRTPSVPPPEGR